MDDELEEMVGLLAAVAKATGRRACQDDRKRLLRLNLVTTTIRPNQSPFAEWKVGVKYRAGLLECLID